MKLLSCPPLKWYVPNYVMFMFTSRIYTWIRTYFLFTKSLIYLLIISTSAFTFLEGKQQHWEDI